MNCCEKVNTVPLNCVDNIIRKIEKDKVCTNSYDRYPIRFLCLPLNNETQSDVLKLSKKIGTEIYELSKLLYHEDAWLSKEAFIDYIEKLPKDKDIILLGFSELVRFFSISEFESVLLSLVIDIENTSENKKRRIYLLCFGLYALMEKILDEKYGRTKIFNPFIVDEEYIGKDTVNVFFAHKDIDTDIFKNKILSSSEWLAMWKKTIDFDQPIMCCSITLYDWYNKIRPDNVMMINLIENEKEVLEKVFNIQVPLTFKQEEKPFWSSICLYAASLPSGQNRLYLSIVSSILNISDFKNADLADKWLKCGDYHKWLLKGYIEQNYLHVKNGRYLKVLLSEMDGYTNEEFISSLWVAIYYNKCYNLTPERKELILQVSLFKQKLNLDQLLKDAIGNIVLQELSNIIPNNMLINAKPCSEFPFIDVESILGNESEYESKINSAIEAIFKDKIKYTLTGTNVIEKNIVVILFSKGIMQKEELKDAYPEFYDYISTSFSEDLDEVHSWINKYFYEYRNSKSNNKGSDLLRTLVNETNKDETIFYAWYYSEFLRTPKEIVDNSRNISKVIILDGVGGEYFDYIGAELQRLGFTIEHASYAKSYLPSTTSESKRYYPESYQPVRDFDSDVIHGDYYSYPNNIVKALSCIQNMLARELTNVKGKIAIIADHGSTILHKIFSTAKKYNFPNVEHDGRCAPTKDNISSNEDYIVYQTDFEDKWILATKEISLENHSKYEAHGGATVEEVITPVFIVSKGIGAEKITLDYKVIPKNLTVSGLRKTVAFTIKPKPITNPVLIDEEGTNYIMNLIDNIWQCELNEGKGQDIMLMVGDKSYLYRTQTTIGKKEVDLFDD